MAHTVRFHPDGRVADPSGRTYTQVTDAITPKRAAELLATGAAVVWDGCGCHGAGCKADWVEGERIERLRRSGRPSVSRIAPGSKRAPSAWIEEWRAADGAVLLYVAGTVVWGAS